MRQQPLHEGDALPRGPDVAPLLAVLAALHREAVIGPEGDDAGAEDFGPLARCGRQVQHGPPERAVANVEGEVEVCEVSLGVHPRQLYQSRGTKTK
ncbi:MAG TPA: hypothetical protein PKE47_04060 [Verrucomicrobiota bacterium]|nr:hypothetical protein [Verrucomicrobiota bacterium]